VEDQAWQAEQFERDRTHLEAVAYRMLGSASEAEDAVQEAWLRLSRSEDEAITNLGGWLPTVVGRVCLDMLRARRSRRELLTGAADVARHTVTVSSRFASLCQPALVNGGPGIIVPAPAGPLAAARITITGDRIVAIDLVLDPARLRTYVLED
jgi:hypothetical protein